MVKLLESIIRYGAELIVGVRGFTGAQANVAGSNGCPSSSQHAALEAQGARSDSNANRHSHATPAKGAFNPNTEAVGPDGPPKLPSPPLPASPPAYKLSHLRPLVTCRMPCTSTFENIDEK